MLVKGAPAIIAMNPLGSEQIFKSIFVKENFGISIKIWLQFIPCGPVSSAFAMI